MNQPILDTLSPVAARLAARYGDAAPNAPATLPDTIALQLEHRSVRGFLPDAPPPEALEAIIAAAQSASTSSNLQQWSVIAIADPARKARLSALCNNQKAILDAPVFLAWLADLSRLERLAPADDPAVSAMGSFESLVEGLIDATLAAQNAVLAAEALGLGAVFIGSLRNRPQEIAAELRLPPRVAPLFGVCIGRPAPHALAGVKPRLPQPAVLHHETYSQDADASVPQYEEVTRRYQAAEGRPVTGWAPPALAKIAAPRERADLRAAYHALGFNLL
jgi:nitroreductase